MALDAAPLMCPFTATSDIFTLKKDITKQHYNNAKLNIPDNASLAVYQVALVGHWLVMGLKTDSSLVHVRLSKMEVAIENITFLTTVGNLAVNQLMERKVATTIIATVIYTKEPKWTTVMAKNMCQVVSRVVVLQP
jgi:hypothetical protein